MKVKCWKGWTPEWERILDVYQDAPSGPGVYMIIADGPINRAVGEDEHGILDVGESDNLKQRLASFVGCARGTRAAGHMAGWRFLEYGFDKHFPLESIWVSWYEVTDKNAAYQKEGEILSEYYRQHLELPPLNFKFNWSKNSQS